MDKIKILFAVGRLTVGGGEKLLVYQLKHLNREKFEPYLLTLFPEKEESFASLVGSYPTNSRVRPYYWKQLNLRRLFDIFSWFKLCRFLKKEKFDVVVTSLFSANLIVRLALLFSGRPKVLISYEHNIYRDKHLWQIWADWFLACFTDKIIVDAESVKKFTSEQEGISSDKFLVMYIPPLASVVKVGPPAGGPTLTDKIVLTVSRLVEEKGHIYLIRAAEKVIKIFPNVKFLIVGWGPLKEELEKEIQSVKTRSPAGDRVLSAPIILVGRRDIAEVLPLADVYVEPALSVDIGIASMEAMAHGLPIISTNVGEMPVFVKDGENGFLVPPQDSNVLAEKILALLKNDDLRKKMGEKSKERVKEFSIAGYMKKFENLILSFLK